MNALTKISTVFATCAIGAMCYAAESFTDDASIMAISREDQANALATHLLKKELTLPEAIVVLTTFQRVSRDQYILYSHQPGARGSVTLKDGNAFAWEIEPGYAARLKGQGTIVIYLLRPDMGKR